MSFERVSFTSEPNKQSTGIKVKVRGSEVFHHGVVEIRQPVPVIFPRVLLPTLTIEHNRFSVKPCSLSGVISIPLGIAIVLSIRILVSAFAFISAIYKFGSIALFLFIIKTGTRFIKFTLNSLAFASHHLFFPAVCDPHVKDSTLRLYSGATTFNNGFLGVKSHAKHIDCDSIVYKKTRLYLFT